MIDILKKQHADNHAFRQVKFKECIYQLYYLGGLKSNS